MPATYTSTLSRWLRPWLNEKGIRYLMKLGEKDLASDDSDWLKLTQKVLVEDVDNVISFLSDDLSFARVRAFHGCRTTDAGSYHRDGIRMNDPQVLAQELRSLVHAEGGLAFYRSDIDRRIDAFDSKDRDTGRVHLALDDRVQTDGAGHYLLYGSEWMQCILGFDAHPALRGWGTPTIVLVDLPLNLVTSGTRHELARVLVQEWTRIKVNRPDWVPDQDFTFTLRTAVPPDLIVGHTHPEWIRDPFHGNIRRRNDRLSCPTCAVDEHIGIRPRRAIGRSEAGTSSNRAANPARSRKTRISGWGTS